MSGVGRWSLGIGLVALVVCIVLAIASVVPVAAGAAVVAFLGIGIAIYDALYEWTARLAREREARKQGDRGGRA